MTVDLVGEHIQALSDSFITVCGVVLPPELALIILFRFGGLRAPTAEVLRIDPQLCVFRSAVAQEYDAHGNFLWRTHASTRSCLCGPGLEPGAAVTQYLRLERTGGAGVVTKKAMCHLSPRRSSVVSYWLRDGPYERELGICRRLGCATTRLWLGMVSLWEPQLIREGLSEAAFLSLANRVELRDAIAKQHGTMPARIEGDDFTSRNEWVRIYYNSLREEGLRDWPRADV